MTSMDDVSLSSPRITTSKSSLLRGSSSGGGASSSSSVSVSSKFSRKSSSFRHSELATPLAPSSSYEERYGYPSPPAATLSPSSTSPNNNSSPSKSYISEDDPFHLFRSDLISKLSQVSTQLQQYLTIIQTTDTAVNIHAIRDSKKQLKQLIKVSEGTLRERVDDAAQLFKDEPLVQDVVSFIASASERPLTLPRNGQAED